MSESKQLEAQKAELEKQLEDLKEKRSGVAKEQAEQEAQSKKSLAGVTLAKLRSATAKQAEQEVKVIALRKEIEELDRRISATREDIGRIDGEIQAARKKEAESELWSAVDNLCYKLADLAPEIEEVGRLDKEYRSKYGGAAILPLGPGVLLNDIKDAVIHAMIKRGLKDKGKVSALDVARANKVGELTIKRWAARVPGIEIEPDGDTVKAIG